MFIKKHSDLTPNMPIAENKKKFMIPITYPKKIEAGRYQHLLFFFLIGKTPVNWGNLNDLGTVGVQALMNTT